MATPQLDIKALYQGGSYSEEVTALMQGSEQINYRMLENKFSPSFLSQSGIKTHFKIDPNVATLPPVEQNVVIRLKLMEWKLEQLQNLINRFAISKSEPLIFKTLFWILSVFIWIASIVGGKILIFFTERYIIHKYWK